MPRAWKRVGAALIVGLASAIAPASVAQADSIVDFKCATVNWKGSIFPTNEPSAAADRSYGTLKHCITVTRKSDSNASYNFFEVRMEDEWNITNNGGWPDNHGWGHIMSSVSATDYKATPTITSDHSCFDAVAFSFSFMGFGVSVRPELCRDSTITRTAQYPSIVHYDAPNILTTHQWDEIYFVKVGQAEHPKFTAAMHYPWYAITYNTTCWCWKNGDVAMLVSLSIQT